MDHNSSPMFGDGEPIPNKQASASAPTGDLLGSDFGSSHDDFDMTSGSLPAAEVGEARKFLDDLMDDAIKSVPAATGKADDLMAAVDPFGFEKPLPPEPKLTDAMSDFLKSEQRHDSPLLSADDEDDERRSPSPMYSRDSDSPSPVPPPVPKHQTPPPAYEPSHTPEPELLPPPSPKPQVVPTSAPSATPPPVISAHQPPTATPPPVKKSPAPSAPPQILDIGTKDIRNKLHAWFNPARLHPAVESLIYWRDPKKSGIVFGITLLSLLSLTCFSLISVVAYLCMFIVGGSLSFRIYKSIMQAVQKTSDGHPFKDYLELDLTIPEDKVTAAAQIVAKYLNTSLTTLRSLFLVEDIVDAVKFLILCWFLTYVGSCFNGLTLIIIGVILLFALPKVYENNKAQIDVYVQIAMEKLSIVTNKVKAAIPGSKKEEKKDQ